MNFKYCCVRDKNQPFIDTSYINNIKKSLNIVFIPYFHKQLKMSFKDMLKAQHKLIVNNTYAGHTNPINKIPKSLFRQEIDIKLNTPILKKEWYTEELKKINPLLHDIIKVEIKDIPNYMWHYVENTENGLKLYLPDNKYVNYYLNKMKTIMLRLKNGEKSLYLLGHYIQLGVICHPFEKVNFSLIMSQVNYILTLWGFEGISHGYLDFECFLNSTDTVIQKFKEKIDFNKKENIK
jgi:hypothetical protein